MESILHLAIAPCQSMLETMRILVVEDDKKIASFVVNGLKQSGYAVDHAADGENGLIMAQTISYDAAVVDVMLPKLDGLSLIQQLRAKGTPHPRADPQRQGLGGRPGARPAGRRRRLPDQALRLLRTAGAHPGADPPRHPHARADPPRGRRPDHGPAHPRGAARRARRSSCSPASSPCWNTSCATPNARSPRP